MTFGEFISDQFTHLDLPISREICSGKVYIVVGGNQGLGLETIRNLVANGAKKVICTVRNTTAGETAKNDVESTTGIRGVMEIWQLDLCSFDSVKKFAKRAASELDRIDAVIANASVALPTFKASERGHEETLMTNVLSTFLYSVMLLPKLATTAKSSKTTTHLVIVSSEVGFYPAAKDEWTKTKSAPLKLSNDKALANMAARYPYSKLIQVLATRQLASLLSSERTGVVINYVNPGLCKTKLSRNATFGTRMMINTMKNLVGRTADQGSRNLLYAAVVGGESHGRYVSTCKVAE